MRDKLNVFICSKTKNHINYGFVFFTSARIRNYEESHVLDQNIRCKVCSDKWRFEVP